jgi:hypothetical protein
MLGLADYGSDDENDDNSNNVVISNISSSSSTTKAIVSSSSSSSSSSSFSSSSSSAPSVTINDKGKKIKKLDFSILPKEIQEALARNDDDDSEDDNKVKRKAIDIDKGSKGNLLSLLPKPKHSIETMGSNTDLPELKSKSSGFNYVSLSETTTISKKKDDVTSSMPNDEEASDEESNSSSILFDINTYNKPQKSIVAPTLAAVSNLDNDVPAQSTHYSNPVQPTIAWDQYYANDAQVGPTLPSNDLQQIHAYNYNYNQPYNMQYQETEANQQLNQNQNQKRKRERDIEQLLLSGNVDALHSLGNVQEIKNSHQWNQAEYLNQKEMARQIHQQYSIDKAGMTNISSVQNKRHQINSLAMKAAETELALLDSRSNLARNKQQAKQKYGW